MVHASKSVTTMQYQARTNGTILKQKTRVDKVTLDGLGVVIETSQGPFRAGKVILAADGWINKLLGPLGLRLVRPP